MKQSNLDLLPVSELTSHLSAFKEGMKWNQMSEVTKVLFLSLCCDGNKKPPSAQSTHKTLLVTQQRVCLQVVHQMHFSEPRALRGQPKGSQESRLISQHQSYPSSANTNHFCSSHCWNIVLKCFTKSGNQGQVPVNGIAQTNSPCLTCENPNQVNHIATDQW